MKEYTKSQVISDLKCKGIEAKYISSLLNKGISKLYLYENYTYNYKKNIDVMKNNGIFLEDYFKNYEEKESYDKSRKRFEQFNDDCAKTLINQKSKKLIRCISSHKKIFNKDTYKYFHTLAELNVSVDFIKNNIAKKIKALDTSDLLNDALTTHIDTFSKWDLNAKLPIIKANYTHVISTQNNKIIFEVEDFDSSKNLGSPMWCITRDNDDFENYRKDSDRIVFCYDFNKEASDNEHKTAYIINAQGHVTSGYYNDDTFMEKEKYSQYEKYFDSYTENDFIQRLESKNYSNEHQILLLIANEFEDNIKDLMFDADFSKLTEDVFQNFVGKNNEKALFKIIEKYPEILITPDNDGRLLNILLNYAESVNYSEFGSDMITSVMSSNQLMEVALKNNLKYTEEFILNISYSRKDSEKQFDLLSENTNYNLKNNIDKLTTYHFSKKIFELFTQVEEKMKLKEHIKSNKELVFSMINCHNNQDAFEYLSLDKTKDKELINHLTMKMAEKTSNINDFNINKNLAKVSENSGNEMTKSIKNVILNRPRSLFTMKREIEQNNIFFSKEETLDICSLFIFEEKYKNSKTLSLTDKYEDLLAFKIAIPFVKGVFGSPSLNMEGLSEFVDLIKDSKITEECKSEEEKEYINSRIALIESVSPISFLNNKIKTNSSKNNLKLKKG
jgi:hypothetical protein